MKTKKTKNVAPFGTILLKFGRFRTNIAMKSPILARRTHGAQVKSFSISRFQNDFSFVFDGFSGKIFQNIEKTRRPKKFPQNVFFSFKLKNTAINVAGVLKCPQLSQEQRYTSARSTLATSSSCPLPAATRRADPSSSTSAPPSLGWFTWWVLNFANFEVLSRAIWAAETRQEPPPPPEMNVSERADIKNVRGHCLTPSQSRERVR